MNESQNFGEVCFVKKESFNDKFNEKKYKISIALQDSLHIFKTYYHYWEVKPDISIDLTKKVKSFLIWLCHILFTIFRTYNPQKKKCKFIKELAEFIYVLYITCSIYSTKVFGWYLCRIQYQKNCFFLKKSLTPLCSLCKLYHEIDCHLFNEYKHKNLLRNQPKPYSRYHEKHPLGGFPRTNSPTHWNVQPWQL